jgi:hypothetical protein
MGFDKPAQFDSDYQAILNYATSLGYALPSNAQKSLQNKLIVQLKAQSLWNKLDSFFVFQTDGSSSFALIDWKRLVTATAVNSPTFTTNVGFMGNGFTNYIDMNFNLLTDKVNMSQDSATYGFYMNFTGSSAYAIGTSLAYTRLAASTSSGNRNNSTIASSGGVMNPGVGYNCFVRNGSNSIVTGKVDGTFTTTGTGLSTAILSQSTYFFRQQTAYSGVSIGSGFIANNFNVTEWNNFVNTYVNGYKNQL